MSRSDRRIVIRVSETTAKALQSYAAEFELPVSLGEAAEALIQTAVGRRAALARYAATQAKKQKQRAAQR